MYALVNDFGDLEVHTDEDDSCYLCKNLMKCPLIQAISKEYVVLRYSEIEVKKCGLFRR